VRIVLTFPSSELIRSTLLRLFVLLFIALSVAPAAVLGQGVEKDVCPRPRAGSIVPEPSDLRSESGVLRVELTYTNFRDALGQMHYCYRDNNGSQAPNLRLHPGDWLVLTLKNELKGDGAPPHQHAVAPTLVGGACGTGAMDGLSTNLHFHGLNVAPVCHQDDVLHTLISPSDPPFEYRLQVPADQPPGGRADFIMQGPPAGVYGNLITQAVDTGPAGENDPVRPLANIMANADAPEPWSTLPASGALPFAAQDSTWLGNAKPVRVRKLYFSERPSDPSNANSRTEFMVTVDGQEPAPYDPRSTAPNMTVRQGDVEEWVIENRTQELHAFHIHQLHFLLEESNGVRVEEPFLRDTVNVGF
jgi:FtsP/CotA-like multicopper oxidase with cupredoxin domain